MEQYIEIDATGDVTFPWLCGDKAVDIFCSLCGKGGNIEAYQALNNGDFKDFKERFKDAIEKGCDFCMFKNLMCE